MTSYIVVTIVISVICATLLLASVLLIHNISLRVYDAEKKLKLAEERISELEKKLQEAEPGYEDFWAFEECEGGVRILAYTGGDELKGTVEIPSVIGGRPVTALGSRLFYECKHIEEVIIPDTVSCIGDAAFCICNSLRSINFPPGLTQIPADCFNECGFTSLVIPDSVTRIRRGAFVNNRKLEEIVLPSGLTEIELMTFAGCKSLRRVVIPSGVKKIADGAFNDCGALSEVILPEELSEIGMMAFLACRSLKSVSIPGSVTVIGDIAFPESTELIRG